MRVALAAMDRRDRARLHVLSVAVTLPAPHKVLVLMLSRHAITVWLVCVDRLLSLASPSPQS
jgi:hypothetical protein